MSFRKPIDPKYAIEVTAGVSPGRMAIVKAATGEEIPEDEPLCLFRSRDELALPMLVRYLYDAVQGDCTAFHVEGICNRIVAFAKFREEHADRMKQPGCTRGQ